MKGFDFEEERIRQEITKLDAKRVLLQLPEGLKPEATRLAQVVEKAGALPIISANPCYGACDLAMDEAELLGVDMIIHFGHARMVRYEEVPTIYIEARATTTVDEAIAAALPLVKNWKTIGLATTVQHIQLLDQVRERLLREGKVVVIGDAGKINYAGQVTGCNYSNVKSISDEVDAFLFIGGGRFHALGIALSTSKPTIIADPYEGRAHSISDDAQKVVKQRWAAIEQATHAKLFGVLVGLKLGQMHLDLSLKVKETIEQLGKTAYLLAVKEVTPEVLLEFPMIEAYVNTACPRISLEAPSKFSKPVLTIPEFRVVSGETTWKNLIRKGLLEN
ncbi:MAG TPA: diphthamide biosynthesis enzyme Dph2 [Candidatus Sulfotelmatobacter sp.]|nr:diphthamide biosynthesis enzyme Dph2 [Candidatus Sulfotelmatobacter sp.]